MQLLVNGLTDSQHRTLLVIRRKGTARFNCRKERPLKRLREMGLINLSLESQPDSKRGSCLVWVASINPRRSEP